MPQNAKDQEAHELYRKIKEAIHDQQMLFVIGKINPIIRRKLNPEILIGWYQRYVAVLDIRQELILGIVHEALHHIKPTWDHRHIYPRQKRILHCVGVVQLCELLKFVLCEASIWLEHEFDFEEDTSDLIKEIETILKETKGAK